MVRRDMARAPDEVASSLFKKRSGGEWRQRCYAHRNPSPPGRPLESEELRAVRAAHYSLAHPLTLLERRSDIGHRGAMHVASLRRIEVARTVHRTAVIP